MPRKRMIDPNIWVSEDFGKLSVLAKIVFIGMFSNADDEGRGRAKPVYLKSILFPYDEGIRVIDIDKTLSEISSNMSVTFYSHDGNEYYVLDNWAKWQKVDKPTPSIIPELDDNSTIIRRGFAEGSPNTPREFAERSPLIEKNKNRIEQEENKKGIEQEEKVVGGAPEPETSEEKINANSVMDAYNTICINNPKAKILTASRRDKLNTRLKEKAFRENYKQVFEIISKTDFLQGKNDRKWKADFDWIIDNDKNYVKVLEGKYSNRQQETTGNPFEDIWRREMAHDQNGDSTDFDVVESSISNDVQRFYGQL